MTFEQATQLLSLLDHTDKVTTSIYIMVAFFVCVVLPLCGLVWFLKSIFSPFFGKIF